MPTAEDVRINLYWGTAQMTDTEVCTYNKHDAQMVMKSFQKMEWNYHVYLCHDFLDLPELEPLNFEEWLESELKYGDRIVRLEPE